MEGVGFRERVACLPVLNCSHKQLMVGRDEPVAVDKGPVRFPRQLVGFERVERICAGQVKLGVERHIFLYCRLQAIGVVDFSGNFPAWHREQRSIERHRNFASERAGHLGFQFGVGLNLHHFCNVIHDEGRALEKHRRRERGIRRNEIERTHRSRRGEPGCDALPLFIEGDGGAVFSAAADSSAFRDKEPGVRHRGEFSNPCQVRSDQPSGTLPIQRRDFGVEG